MRRSSRILATAATALLVLASPIAAAPSAGAASGPVPDFKTRPLCIPIINNPAISCFMQGTATGGSQIVSWDWEYPGMFSDHATGQFPVLQIAPRTPIDVTLTVVDDQNRTGTVTKSTTIQIGAWPLRAPNPVGQADSAELSQAW